MRLLFKKNVRNGADKEKIVNLFIKPQKDLKANTSITQWGQSIEKIYQLFFVVICFYIIFSLPVCKNADFISCMKWADQNLKILSDVLLEREKKDLYNLNPKITEILSRLGISNGVYSFQNEKEKIDQEITRFIDEIDFNKKLSENTKAYKRSMDVLQNRINTLSYRFILFRGNCIRSVIAPNQFSEFFFQIYNPSFSAKSIVFIDEYNEIKENDSELNTYGNDSSDCDNDYIFERVRYKYCKKTNCPQNKSCLSGIPVITKLRLENVTFGINDFESVQQSNRKKAYTADNLLRQNGNNQSRRALWGNIT